MLGLTASGKPPHVDTPKNEHPLETPFALFVTLRCDEGNPSGSSVFCLQGGFPCVAPTPRAHSPRAQRCLCRRDRWALEVGGSASFSVPVNSSLASGRVGPTPVSGGRSGHWQAHTCPRPRGHWAAEWPAVTWAGLADREGLRAGASKVTGDRATCDPRTLTSA